MKKQSKENFLSTKMLLQAIKDAFLKLNPKYMIKNPVMFVVEIGFFITVLLSIFPSFFEENSDHMRTYNIIVCLVLLVTVLFANFAEAIAEGRGKSTSCDP